MPAVDLLPQRLHNHQLSRSNFQTPERIVAWLGALQAQDYAGAKWAIGLRGDRLTDAVVEKSFSEGRILRTHILRPTWHFVAPADLRWMLALSAPRVHAFNAYSYRKLGLNDTLFARSRRAIEKALGGGAQLTRSELAGVLLKSRIAAESQRLAYLMMHAELEGVICSGARRGKQFTYALLDERVPPAPTLGRDEALAQLTERYFTSHGPATLRDFVWWSGLLVRDAKTGLAMASGLRQVEIRDRSFWLARDRHPASHPASSAHFLPNYDEYLIAYKDRGEVVAASRAVTALASSAREFPHHIVIDGKLAGSWRRVLDGPRVRLEAASYTRLSKPRRLALRSAARRYSDFLGVPVEVQEV